MKRGIKGGKERLAPKSHGCKPIDPLMERAPRYTRGPKFQTDGGDWLCPKPQDNGKETKEWNLNITQMG